MSVDGAVIIPSMSVIVCQNSLDAKKGFDFPVMISFKGKNHKLNINFSWVYLNQAGFLKSEYVL